MNENLTYSKYIGGVIPFKTKDSDYIAGGETGIAFEERITNGDWRKHRPTGEKQYGIYFDTMGCTFFSGYNSIEEQIDYLIISGKLKGEKLQKFKDWGFFDENGKFNISDRFGNFVGGTTQKGNYLYKPWETSATYGILPEKDWPFPNEQRAPTFTWEDYYIEPGLERREKAKLVLSILDFKYEIIFNGVTEMTDSYREKMRTHIKQAPLHIASPVCPGWGTDPVVQKCDKKNTEHATIIDNIDDLENFFYCFDHYIPFGKILAKDYCIPTVIKGVVSVKEDPVVTPVAKFHHCFYTKLVYGQRSEEIKALQKALKILGYFPVKVLETGYYGNITKDAVNKCYLDNKIDNIIVLKYINGRWVGPKLRTYLNSIFNC